MSTSCTISSGMIGDRDDVQRIHARNEENSIRTEYNRKRRQILRHGNRLSISEQSVCQSIDNFRAFKKVTDARIYTECSKQLSNRVMTEKVCCVCDCLFDYSSVKEMNVASSPNIVAAMISRLTGPSGLPANLRSHYNVSSVYKPFHSVLLSSKGVARREGSVFIQLCRQCLTALSRRSLKPPKFAIANGLFIGSIPAQFDDTSMTENAMLNLAQPTHFMTVVRGGKQSTIRSHAYFFRADPATPADLLPRGIASDGIIGVIMIGAMTPNQKISTQKKYQARIVRLREQLAWYKINNYLFAAVQDNPQWEDTASRTTVIVDKTRDEHQREKSCDTGNPEQDLDDSTRRFNAPCPAHWNTQEEDESCEQVASALITNFVCEDHHTVARRILENNNVVVSRSSSILSDFDPSFWTMAFSDLFPYGRGGLDEPRIIPIE